MKNNNLLSVRSNCTFALDYKKGTLHPSTEIILITSSPKYVMSKEGDSFKKDQEVSEYRFITSLDGVNQLIGELQLKNVIITTKKENWIGINCWILQQSVILRKKKME